MTEQAARHDARNTYALGGRVALVTGASGALGGAVAVALAKAGATVGAAVREERADDLAALRQRAGPAGERLSSVAADVTDEGAVERLIAGVVARYGRLDVAMNTVGGYQAGRPVTELDLATWQAMMDLNLRATFLVSKHAGSVMARAGFGRIVNVASRAARGGQGRDAAAYAVSKAGVVTLTEAQADELRDAGVTVNAVLPGIIDTPANRRAMPGADASRWPTPEQIARVMLFLASDDAALISGASIPVYGRA